MTSLNQIVFSRPVFDLCKNIPLCCPLDTPKLTRNWLCGSRVGGRAGPRHINEVHRCAAPFVESLFTSTTNIFAVLHRSVAGLDSVADEKPSSSLMPASFYASRPTLHHIRQARPDSGLYLSIKVFKMIQAVPSPFDSCTGDLMDGVLVD